MAIFNDYGRDGKFVGQRDEPITAQNVDRYITEHGSQQAIGYFEAMNDFKNQFTEVLGHAAGIDNAPTYSPHQIKKRSLLLLNHLSNILNELSDNKSIKNYIKPDQP